MYNQHVFHRLRALWYMGIVGLLLQRVHSDFQYRDRKYITTDASCTGAISETIMADDEYSCSHLCYLKVFCASFCYNPIKSECMLKKSVIPEAIPVYRQLENLKGNVKFTNEECKMHGMRMVTPKNDVHRSALMSQIPSIPMWVGLSRDPFTNSTYDIYTEEKVTYPWDGKQPNGGRKSTCVMVNANSKLLWDKDCGEGIENALPVVCEERATCAKANTKAVLTYVNIDATVNYYTAMRNCIEAGMTIVTPMNEDQRQMLLDQIPELSMWVGLKVNEDNTEIYDYVTGERVEYLWAAGQPSGYGECMTVNGETKYLMKSLCSERLEIATVCQRISAPTTERCFVKSDI